MRITQAAELAVAVISVAAVEAAYGNDFDVSLPKTFLKGNADVCPTPHAVDQMRSGFPTSKALDCVDEFRGVQLESKVCDACNL